MSAWLWVALGGALGSAARYGVGLATAGIGAGRWPVATFLVNLAGCFAIGLLAAALERHVPRDEGLRAFLVVGVLGGFTTFSAFGLETLVLLRRGDWLIAGAYAAGSVFAGVAAAALGAWLASR